MAIPEVCISCASDNISYHCDGDRQGEEIWICHDCGTRWAVTI